VVIIGFALVILVGGWSFFRWYQSQAPAIDTSHPKIDTTASAQTGNRRDPLIRPDELQQRLSQSETAAKTLLLDARDPKSFQSQHLANSINITSDTLNGSIPSVHPDDLLVVLIGLPQDEDHLRTIALQVQRDGISAAALQGGFQAWADASGQFISAGDTSSFVDASKVTVIAPDQAKQLFDSNASGLFAFIDTRFPASFQAGHIPGALNIPLEQLESRRQDIPLGKRLILYNDAPVPAFQSAVRVFDLGFSGAQTIEGGFSAWVDKQYPVEK